MKESPDPLVGRGDRKNRFSLPMGGRCCEKLVTIYEVSVCYATVEMLACSLRGSPQRGEARFLFSWIHTVKGAVVCQRGKAAIYSSIRMQKTQKCHGS